jgi:hypothetical protein
MSRRLTTPLCDASMQKEKEKEKKRKENVN